MFNSLTSKSRELQLIGISIMNSSHGRLSVSIGCCRIPQDRPPIAAIVPVIHLTKNLIVLLGDALYQSFISTKADSN